MVRFECYEDNGGMLHLFIIGKNGAAIAGYGNFEHESGSLAAAIAEIDDYCLFGGDYGGDIDMPPHSITNDDGETVADREMTIDELYREYADDETSTLIAWSDGKVVAYCDKDHMGFAARSALNLHRG